MLVFEGNEGRRGLKTSLKGLGCHKKKYKMEKQEFCILTQVPLLTCYLGFHFMEKEGWTKLYNVEWWCQELASIPPVMIRSHFLVIAWNCPRGIISQVVTKMPTSDSCGRNERFVFLPLQGRWLELYHSHDWLHLYMAIFPLWSLHGHLLSVVVSLYLNLPSLSFTKTTVIGWGLILIQSDLNLPRLPLQRPDSQIWSPSQVPRVRAWPFLFVVHGLPTALECYYSDRPSQQRIIQSKMPRLRNPHFQKGTSSTLKGTFSTVWFSVIFHGPVALSSCPASFRCRDFTSKLWHFLQPFFAFSPLLKTKHLFRTGTERGWCFLVFKVVHPQQNLCEAWPCPPPLQQQPPLPTATWALPPAGRPQLRGRTKQSAGQLPTPPSRKGLFLVTT